MFDFQAHHCDYSHHCHKHVYYDDGGLRSRRYQLHQADKSPQWLQRCHKEEVRRIHASLGQCAENERQHDTGRLSPYHIAWVELVDVNQF